MSKLITIEEWIGTHYSDNPGQELDKDMVLRWIEDGQLSSVIKGDKILIPEGAMVISDDPRSGEAEVVHARSSRLVKNGVPWHFLARGGESVGPFNTVEEAKQALHDFVTGIKDKD